jgi:hypothetical protein
MAYRLLLRLFRLIPLLVLGGLVPVAPLLAAPAAIRHPQSALAQPAGLTMRVRAAYDGHYKVGEWFPIQVDLSNDGQGTVAGQVQVTAKNDNGGDVTTYARDIELPSPSRKQVTLTTFAATYARSFDVRLMSGSTILLKQTISVDPVEYPAFLLGVVSADTGLLNVLNGESLGTLGSDLPNAGPINSSTNTATRATVAHLQPGDLPASAAALAGLDALILAGTDTSNLAAEVHAALESWVLRGGTLVVAGNGTTTAGLSDLLPVQVSGTRQATDFSALSAYSGIGTPLQSAGAVLVAAATPLPERGAQVLASDPAGPLLVARPYGAGTILFLALDPAQPPLLAWPGTVALWQRALGGTSVSLSSVAERRMVGYPNFGYGYGGADNPLSAGVELPNAWLVGGFLLAYVLLVGPLNYLILRARKQLELSWATIPVLIAVFVVGAYVLGLVTRGSDTRLIQSSVIRVYDTAPQATVDSFIGILSPDRRTYDLAFTGDLPLTELDASAHGLPRGNPAVIVQGRPTTVRKLPLDTWALRGFVAEGALAYADPFSATLRLENGRIVGELRNRSAEPLHDVGVLYGSATALVGDLAPGQQASVNLAPSTGYAGQTLIDRLLPGLSSGSSQGSRVLQRRVGLLSSLLATLPPGGSQGQVRVALIGWNSTAPLGLQVPGQQVRAETTTLIAGEAAVGLPVGQWTLPRYLIGWQVVSGETNTGYGYGGGQLDFSLGNGPVVFQFVLPPGFQAATLSIGCDLSTYNGLLQVQPTLYNWTTGQFDPVLANGQPQMIQNTVNGSFASTTLEVPTPVASYVGPRGEVRLRLSGQSGITDLQLQDLYISGTSR